MSTKRYKIKATCYDKRGRVISSGENNYRKSHPLMQRFAKEVGLENKIYLHAEVQALLRAGDREIHTIFVERYNADGSPATARPCPICQKAISYFGVKRVIFTDLVIEDV